MSRVTIARNSETVQGPRTAARTKTQAKRPPGILQSEDLAIEETDGGNTGPDWSLDRMGIHPPVRVTSATPRIQTKLKVGGKDSPSEREAEEVADQVSRRSLVDTGRISPDSFAWPVVRRQTSAKEPEQEEEPVLVALPARDESGSEGEIAARGQQGAAAGESWPGLGDRLQALRGRGLPLPGRVLADLGAQFGTDFSRVRIHADSEAASLSERLHADAFTHGSDVYFNRHRYQPESTDGRRLLAHELTHVVQQEGAERLVQRQPKSKVKDPGMFSFSIPVKGPMSAEDFLIRSLSVIFSMSEKAAKDLIAKQGWHWEDVSFTGPTAAGQVDVRLPAAAYYRLRGAAGGPAGERDSNGRLKGAADRDKSFGQLSHAEQVKITAATNQRFWNQTKYKPGQQLGDSPQDKQQAKLWKNMRDEILIDRETLHSLPPEIAGELGGEKGFRPENYEQLVRIANKLKATDPKDRAILKLHSFTDDLDAVERAVDAGAVASGKGPEAPEDLGRLYRILQEKVEDIHFGDKGDDWTRFARFLEKNKDKVEGILNGGPDGKLNEEKIRKIVDEYGKYIAAEPVDKEAPDKLETFDDYEKQFQYDPGWQKLSKEDRKLLVEYAKMKPEDITDGKVDFTRVTTGMKEHMALKLADTSFLGEAAEAAKAAFSDPAFLVSLVLIVAIYVGLWLTPEPSGVTKVAAGLLTFVLLAQFAWQDIYGFAKAWFDFGEDCEKAKSVAELKAAGEKFLKKIGPIGFDIMLAIAMWGLGKAFGPKLSKMGQNRAVARGESAVRAAEARPGAGVKQPATPESAKAWESARASGKTPAEKLDALNSKLSPEGQKGLKDFRGNANDARVADTLEAKNTAGEDISHFLEDYGASAEAKTAAKAALLEARGKLARSKLMAMDAAGDPGLKKAVEAEAESLGRQLAELKALDDPAVQQAAKARSLADLVGSIGEAMGRALLGKEYAGKGNYKVLGNIEVVREVPGYKTIPEWKAAMEKAGKPSKTAGLRQGEGKIYQALGEADGLAVDQAGGKMKPVETEQVKTGAGDKSDFARQQNQKFLDGVREAAAGKKDVKIVQAGEPGKLGADITSQFDLSDLSGVKQSTRGLPGKAFDKQLPYPREVLMRLAELIVERGLPTAYKPWPALPPTALRPEQKPEEKKETAP